MSEKGQAGSQSVDGARVRLERAILSRMAEGDRTALEELYQIYAKPLYSYAIKVLGSREDAEEALQDTFVRLWKKADGYDPSKAKPYAWAVLILRGLCYDRLRKRNKKSALQCVSITARPDYDRAEEKSIDDLFFRETTVRVKNALALLEESERACVELAVFAGASHAGIADALGQPLGTVKSRVRRGMLKLREILNSEES